MLTGRRKVIEKMGRRKWANQRRVSALWLDDIHNQKNFLKTLQATLKPHLKKLC